MKALVAHIGALAGCLICLYAAIWVLSMLLYPPTNTDSVLDTSQAAHTIYMTEPKYIYLNRAPLERTGAKVILVGASNTVVGFRPRDLAPMIKDAAVENLAIGGANITETAQVIDLATQSETLKARHNTTFVLGIWYGMFASNKSWWFSPDRHGGDTDIDIERYRYGFCWRTAAGPLTVVPPRYIDAAVLAIHPYLVAEKLVRDVTTFVDVRILGHKSMRSEAQRDNATVDEAQRAQLLSYWTERMGPSATIPPEQFEVLRNLILKILSAGSSVVLVDLPLPRWHATRSPYLPSYYRQLLPVVDAFKDLPGFRFVRLDGLSDDNDFSDEVHPKPSISIEWSRQLANILNRTSTREVDRDVHLSAAIQQEPLS